MVSIGTSTSSMRSVYSTKAMDNIFARNNICFSGVTTDNDNISAWMRAHASANRAADEVFYRLGYWVATHPKLTLLLNVVFVALCSIGFLNFKVVTDGEKMGTLTTRISARKTTLTHHFIEF